MTDWTRLLLAVLGPIVVASGCAHPRYDLAGDSILVPPVEVRALRQNVGRVEVVLRQDLRLDSQKSHNNLGTQYVTDSAWSEPIAQGLPRLVANALQKTGLFAAATTVEGKPDYRLEISLHSLRGVWVDGTWNYLLPWGEMPIEARIDLEIFIWGRDEAGRFSRLHFHHRYERATQRAIGPYRNGHRIAAEEIGRLLHDFLEHLVIDIGGQLDRFGLPGAR